MSQKQMLTDTGRELRAVVFLDGRPGHEKQTMGIVRALQQKVSLHCIEVKLKKATVFDKLVQSFFLFFPFLKLSSVEGVVGIEAGSDDLVRGGALLLGTGSSCHLPMLLYKRKYALPAYICMAPAVHLRKFFDLCFVPEHDGLREDTNVMVTAGAPNCSVDKQQHNKNYGLILIGGEDLNSHHWDSAAILQMVDQLLQKDAKKSWTISSSPRTPSDTIELIRELEQKYDQVHFFDYKETPPGWVEEQYDKNEEVWVTADSISMVYEALSAGCRVGIFPMQWIKMTGKFKKNEDTLLNKNMVLSFSAWQAGDRGQWQSVVLNEADRCANRLLDQLKL